MRKGALVAIAVVLLAVLLAGGAQAWVRLRMFDACTPAGPNWPLLERPAWEVSSKRKFEEMRSGELNGPSGDKRFSWRVRLGGESADGACDVRIPISADSVVTSVLWEGCVATFTKPGYSPSDRTPQFYIRAGVGTLKIAYNNDTTGGASRGWYCYSENGKNGTRTGGGVTLFGTTYGIPVDHGIWHRVRVTLNIDGAWHVWVNDQQGNTNELWGNLGAVQSTKMIRWGVPDGQQKTVEFYTRAFHWGQGTGEIDPIPGPGEAYDIGGVSVTAAGNSATIKWDTEQATTINKVYFGDTFHTLDQAADAVWNTDHWEAHLNDLDWSKTYTFYCESTDVSGQEYDTGLYTFKTDPIVLSQIVNPGFESGVDIYPWVDVFPPAPGPPEPDDTQRWGRVYSDIDTITAPGTSDALPATPMAFSGFKTAQTAFREYGTIRQKVAVTPGNWYKAQVRFCGWGNIPYAPDDMVGRIGLDPNGDDAPGQLLGGMFFPDADVWWGQAGAGIHGDYRTASVMCQAVAPEMSVFLQTSYNLGNSGVRIAFDDVTFTETAAPAPVTCGGAKLAPDINDFVVIPNVVVTMRRVLYASPSMDVVGYVEDANRAAGIRLSGSQADWDSSLDVGAEVDVSGPVTRNADGELEIRVRSITPALVPSGAAVKPVGVTNKSLGGGPFGLQARVEVGTGMNNIGLLVEAWGRVTGVGDPDPSGDYSVFIDDGSNLTGGVTGSNETRGGIEVALPAELYIDPTTFVPDRTCLAVVGASSTKLWDPDGHSGTWNSLQKRVVRIRSASDLAYVVP